MVLISRPSDAIRAIYFGDVSVPLRGLWFLSTAVPTTLSMKTMRSFRPLAGIMVLILYYDVMDEMKRGGRFRPLAGIMVLI